ncbi:hypothetical protein [Huintestinicola sp.]
MKFKAAFLAALYAVMLFTADVSANETEINSKNFPDDIFREYVSQKFDRNNDGKLSAEELKADKYKGFVINVSGMKIKDLSGIELFAELTELDCTDTLITELDVSKNRKLRTLICGRCGITGLDVTNNPLLETLECSNGYFGIGENEYASAPGLIDLSKNKKLKRLVLQNAMLTQVDVSKNTGLVYLDVSWNYLEGLDVTNNTALEELNCTWSFVDPEGGLRNVSQPDISQNKKLKKFCCGQNGFEEIDVSGNPELTVLSVSYNKMHQIDVSKNPKLTKLDCEENELYKLDVSQNKELTWLDCSYNRLMKLDLSEHDKLTELYCQKNKLRDIALTGCTSLESLDCTYNLLDALDVSDCQSLTKLDARNNRLLRAELYHPDKGEKREKVDYYFSDNRLISIDCSGYKKYDVSVYWQYRSIKVINGKYDLAELESCGLDPTKITFVNGAEYDAKENAFVNFTRGDIYYDYDLGNEDNATFYLYAKLYSDDASKKPFLFAYNTDQAVIGWDNISGADKYEVQRYNEDTKKWETVCETRSDRFYDDDIEEDVTYKYRVCAYVNGKRGPYSDVAETGTFRSYY